MTRLQAERLIMVVFYMLYAVYFRLEANSSYNLGKDGWGLVNSLVAFSLTIAGAASLWRGRGQ